MAERIVSPGVFTEERDLSFLPQGISDIGAAIIGPTEKGPAFTPTILSNFQEFENKLFVALTTEESEDAELQKELLTVAVRWARLRLRQKSGTVDAALIIQKIESVQRNMKKFSTIKGKCTGIKDVAEEIRDDLDELNDIIKDDLKSVAESLN